MGGRALAAVVLCAASALVSLAHASEDALVARVEALLTAGFEPGSAHATIAALGEPGERALQQVFEQPSTPRYARLRALSEIATFDTALSAAYLQGLVQRAHESSALLGDLHPARSALTLRRALDGLKLSAHWLRGTLDVDALTACLQHPDAHVRKSAAELLAELGDGPAKIDQALSTQLGREPSRMVRASVARAITSRSARSRAPR